MARKRTGQARRGYGGDWREYIQYVTRAYFALKLPPDSREETLIYPTGVFTVVNAASRVSFLDYAATVTFVQSLCSNVYVRVHLSRSTRMHLSFSPTLLAQTCGFAR